jgi:uncharacterized OB-fold protein
MLLGHARQFGGKAMTEKIELIGEPAGLFDQEKAWVINFPRSLTHRHTYGLLTPFFQGLAEGRLMATRCTNPRCGEDRLWLPCRAHCPDCWERMSWEEIPQPVVGKIYTFTQVVYAGIEIELSTPYWQIDVELPGLATIFKGYLLRGEPQIGMSVRAGFRTENPTHTILDIYWEPYEA